MDASLQSIIYFIIITLVYFIFPSIGKPQLELKDLENDETKSMFYCVNR